MKRIWFGAGLLVLLLVLSLICSALMENPWKIQSENLNRAARLAADGDWSAVEDLMEVAKQKWNQKQLLVSALFHHDTIDQIDGLFAQLEIYRASRRAVSFSSTCVYLSRLLDSLGQSHSFNLKNLL